jgi:hypothetical protein
METIRAQGRSFCAPDTRQRAAAGAAQLGTLVLVALCNCVHPAGTSHQPPHRPVPVQPRADSSARRTIRLPKLMTQGFYLHSDVCADARKNHPDKKLALVALQSHICDYEGQACLRNTRDLSDTCNRFVQSNFALYRTRLYRNSADRSHYMEEDPEAWQIVADWSNSGPTLFVVDVSECRTLGLAGPGIAGIGGHEHAPLPEPEPALRFELTKNQILQVPDVRELLGTGVALGPDLQCLQQRGPTIDEVWAALEIAQPL